MTGKIACSASHGGFDNDAAAMNSLLKRILGKSPLKPFDDDEMKGHRAATQGIGVVTDTSPSGECHRVFSAPP